MRKTVI